MGDGGRQWETEGDIERERERERWVGERGILRETWGDIWRQWETEGGSGRQNETAGDRG